MKYHFKEYENLTEPNIIVDGLANSYTQLTLSHWPNSGTPAELKADLSTEIAFNYLNNPKFHINVPYVSNNHFDEDGLTSIFTLVYPDKAKENKEILIEIGRVGDFKTYELKNATRIVFTINNMAQEIENSSDGLKYEKFLDLLPNFISNIDEYGKYWENDEQDLLNIQSFYKNREISIEIEKKNDLAIIRLPSDESNIRIENFLELKYQLALHNFLDVYRVLLIQNYKYRFYYRYESFVECVTKTPLPRVDLNNLISKLNKVEKVDKWQYNGFDDLSLKNGKESSISEKDLYSLIIKFHNNEIFGNYRN